MKTSDGQVTSPFGARWGTQHNGMDIAGPIGTPIHATADGIVSRSGWASGYGNLVQIALYAAIFAVLGLLPRGTHEYARFIRPSELARWLREAR